MLSVSKYSFKFIFGFTRAMAQYRWNADIPSVAFVFDEDLACQLEIEDLSDTEGILLP